MGSINNFSPATLRLFRIVALDVMKFVEQSGYEFQPQSSTTADVTGKLRYDALKAMGFSEELCKAVSRAVCAAHSIARVRFFRNAGEFSV